MINLIYFVIILGIIVLIHESGHFLFAKLFGVYVHEFSIGMGPKLISWKSKHQETTYSIRAIPIGGFCALAGEEANDSTNIPEDRKLYTKPIWQRFLVMFFGAGFNFISAIIFLFLMGLIWGSPSSEPIIGEVLKGNPAYEAGLKENDYVLKINDHKIKTADDMLIYLQTENRSRPITFLVRRDHKEYEIKVKPVEEVVDGSKVYRIGVKLSSEVETGFMAAIDYAFTKTGSLFRQMIVTFKSLFTGNLSVNQLSGPVGIYSIVGEQREAGFKNIIYLIALLSINVGFINLIPFPAFDGGRIVFLFIEKIKGSPVKGETESLIHSIGFFLLIALMIFITFNDIVKLF
ncbi:MAG: RIP metalloprotease RseP [bacterium]|nr:RIP metalloprotease RseP [bacterium]